MCRSSSSHICWCVHTLYRYVAKQTSDKNAVCSYAIVISWKENIDDRIHGNNEHTTYACVCAMFDDDAVFKLFDKSIPQMLQLIWMNTNGIHHVCVCDCEDVGTAWMLNQRFMTTSMLVMKVPKVRGVFTISIELTKIPRTGWLTIYCPGRAICSSSHGVL